jgi:hypothetical protein
MLIFLHKIFPHGILVSKRILFFLALLLLEFTSDVFTIELGLFQFAGIRSSIFFYSIGTVLIGCLIYLILQAFYQPLCESISRRRHLGTTANFTNTDFYKFFRLHHNAMVRINYIQIFKELIQFITLGVSRGLEANNQDNVLLRCGVMQTVSSHNIFNKTG